MDFMHSITDDELARLERDISKIYTQASKELTGKTKLFFKDFEKDVKVMAEKVANKEMSKNSYNNWLKSEIIKSKHFKELQKSYASTLTNSNVASQNIINGKMNDIFMQNSNYMGFILSKTGYSFSLYDETTVKRLIRDEPNLLPKKKINKKKSVRYNKKQVSRQITQGIIQGESVNKIANRLIKNIPNMNKHSAITNARTAVTCAENAGRDERINWAKDEYGLDIQEIWLATLNSHTRDTHRLLDGSKKDKHGYFVSESGAELKYPGDSSCGDPSEVYNCRCTMTVEVGGYKGKYESELNQIRESEKYKIWAGGK